MNDKYTKLIARYLSGEAAEEEKKMLHDWIASSEKNRVAFEESENAWMKIPIPQTDEIPPFHEFWQSIVPELETSAAHENGRSFSLVNKFFTPRRIGYALAFASVVVLLVFAGKYFFRQETDSLKIQTYATRYAERKLLELPDGSTAELNSDSRLSYTNGFSENTRQVKFSGEAFFKIKKDGRPFIIQTDNAEIKVLGTQFDVKARDYQTEVIVKEGRVAFKSNKTNIDSVVVLKANEKSICRGDFSPQAAGSVNAELMIAWIKHKLVFKKTPLKEIVNELERTFDKKITLSGRDLGHLTVTGEFKDQDLDEILSSICLTLNLKSRKVNEGYLISQ